MTKLDERLTALEAVNLHEKLSSQTKEADIFTPEHNNRPFKL